MILSLAKPGIQATVHDEFSADLSGKLNKIQPVFGLKKGRGISYFLPESLVNPLGLTWQALGIPADSLARTSMTSSQLEISRALHTGYNAAQVKKIVNYLDNWFRDLSTISSLRTSLQMVHDELFAKARGRLAPDALKQADDLEAQTTQENGEYFTLKDKSTPRTVEEEARFQKIEQQQLALVVLNDRAIKTLTPADKATYQQSDDDLNKTQTASSLFAD